MFKPEINIQNIINFIHKYRTQFLSGFGIFIFFIAFIVYFIIRYQTVMKETKEKLAMAENLFYFDRHDDALRIFDEIIQRHSTNKYGFRAMLFKAYILYKRKDFVQARDIFNRIVSSAKPNEFVVPLAYFGLGCCNENLRDYQAAVVSYNNFLSGFSEHYLTPKVYASLSRIYEIQGATQQAKQIYEKLLITYPGSYWSKLAENKLKK